MTDIPFNQYGSMSDEAIARKIGAYIRHHRIAQSKTQDELAKEAGISRSTLSLLERGSTVTLGTFIQVLRVLDLLHTLDAFSIEEVISPLALVKEQKSKRKRVRKSSNNNPTSDW